MLTFIVGIIMTFYLPQVLGVEEYSKYAILSVCVNFFIPICSLGLVSYIIRFYKTEDKIFDLGLNSKIIYCIGLVLTLVIVCIYSLIFDLSFNDFLSIYFAVSLLALVSISAGYYRAKDDANAYFNLVASQKILHFIIFVIISEFFYTSAILYFLSSIISCFLILLITRFRCFPVVGELEVSIKTVKYGLSFCIPIAIANISITFIPVIERNLILSIFDSDVLSQFVFNYELITKFTSISLLVIKVIIWPHIACGNKNIEISRYEQTLKNSLIILTVIILIGSVFIKLIYQWLIENVFNMSTYSNEYLMILLFISSCIIIMNYIVNLGSMIMNKTSIISSKTAIVIVFHTLGIMVLSQYIYIYGVVISMIFAQIISLSYSIIKNKKEIKLSFNYEC